MYKKITAVAMVAVLAAMTASAGLIIDTGTPVSGGQGNYELGQTFTTGTLGTENVLTSIGIYGPASGAGATAFNLELWTLSDANPAALNLGTKLDTSGLTAVVDGNANVSVFTFSGGAVLADDTSYAFISTIAGVRSIVRIGVTNASSPDDAGGNLFGGTTYPHGGAYDASMQITTAIPEPATLGMVAVFGGGLLFIRRKLMM